MSEMNPFSNTRFEYESRHLYYLPGKLLDKLEQSKPVYMRGTRGTGKTTLLKALSWDERLSNESLQSALANRPFQKHFIGVYLKLAKLLPFHFKEWLTSDPRGDAVFSLYFDLLWLEELVTAIATLSVRNCRGERLFRIAAEDEGRFVECLLARYPILREWNQFPSDPSLNWLGDLFRLMRTALQAASMSRADVAATMANYPSEQIGEFGRSVSRLLAALCDEHSQGGAKWYFKVCIDEAEWLSEEQSWIINTVARLSEWPTFYVVSYVEDLVSTLRTGVHLTDADRSIIRLDTITEDHPDFFEGVASVRVRRAMNSTRTTFSLRRILGRLDINFLLRTIIKESKSPAASQWLKKAQELQDTVFWSNTRNAVSEDGSDNAAENPDVLPIYQAYAIERLGFQDLLRLEPGKPGWSKREQKKAAIRKRMVASYLCLCNELGKRDVLYAYAEMVKQMSDNCVRDFLNQINEIFLESKRDLPAFLKRQVPVKVQNVALVRASNNKIRVMDRSSAAHPNQLGRVVEGLGYVTRILQSEGISALKSNERGCFSVAFDQQTYSYADLQDLIDEGVENGYLRLVGQEADRIVFRLHCSLAASFRFSYRGAYTETSGLAPADLAALADASDAETVRGIAESVAKRMARVEDANQLTLFGGPSA